MSQRFKNVTMTDRLLDLGCSAREINGLTYRGERIPLLDEIERARADLERSRREFAMRERAATVQRRRLTLRAQLRQMRAY